MYLSANLEYCLIDVKRHGEIQWFIQIFLHNSRQRNKSDLNTSSLINKHVWLFVLLNKRWRTPYTETKTVITVPYKITVVWKSLELSFHIFTLKCIIKWQRQTRHWINTQRCNISKILFDLLNIIRSSFQSEFELWLNKFWSTTYIHKIDIVIMYIRAYKNTFFDTRFRWTIVQALYLYCRRPSYNTKFRYENKSDFICKKISCHSIIKIKQIIYVL